MDTTEPSIQAEHGAEQAVKLSPRPDAMDAAAQGPAVAGGEFPPGKLHVAAVSTHSERYFPLLVQSCRRLGVHLEVLGWGEKLSGFAFRLQKTLEYVDTLPRDDVVMLIDAFDVILLQNADVILKKFYASGAQMIISKDGVHPNKIIQFFINRVFAPVGDTPINIGAYVGYAGFIADLMRALAAFGEGFSSKENDQELLARYCAKHKYLIGKEIVIDVNNDFALNLYAGHPVWIGSNSFKMEEHEKEIEILKDGTLHYLPTDSYPCVLHGPCNSDLTEIFDRLGYQVPKDIDSNYSSVSHIRYLGRMFGHYWKFVYGILFKFFIVVVCLIVIGYMFYAWRRHSGLAPTAGLRQNLVTVPYQPWQPPPQPAPHQSILIQPSSHPLAQAQPPRSLTITL